MGAATDFEAAVARHQRRVYTFAHYFLANREEAEDVTQEVLLRLWRQGDRVDHGMLGAWLMRVTRNACYDRLRRRRAGPGLVELGGDPESRPAVLESVASGDPDPEQKAQSADFERRLRRALDELPEPFRSVLIMREIQEMPYQEISEVLEIPLNTVRVYIHRGRRKLRERLHPEVASVSAAIG